MSASLGREGRSGSPSRKSEYFNERLFENKHGDLSRLLSCQALTALNLSSNELDGGAIRSCAPHLGTLSCLESLDLSCNRIDALLGLPFLPCLSRLLVPYNRLRSLDGIQALASSLTHLDARDNRIAGPTSAHAPHLAALGRLETLVLASPGKGGVRSNPLCACREYRRVAFAAARSLRTLDGETADGFETVVADVSGGGVRRAPRGERNAATVATGIEDPPTPGRVGGNLEEMAAAAPEEVPIVPRFDALADRFRTRRSRVEAEGGVGGVDDGESSSSGVVVPSRPADDESTESDAGWSEGGDVDLQECQGDGENIDRIRIGRGKAGRHHPEKSMAGRRKGRGGGRGGAKGNLDERGGSWVGDSLGEDAAEENGLLSRLRSVAQEARLEVMDSRLQDLHDKQARDALATRRQARTAAAAPAAPRRGFITSSQREGFVEADAASGARRASRSNPWAQPPAASQPREARRSVASSTARDSGSTVPLRSNNFVGDRSVRWTRAFGGVASGIVGNGESCTGDGATLAGAGSSDALGFEETRAAASCPYCRIPDVPETALDVAVGKGVPGGTGRGGREVLEILAQKHLSDASTQASRGLGTTARTIRVPSTPAAAVASSVVGNAWTGKASSPVGGMSVGRAVAAAALAGAAAAALSGLDDRRLIVCFSRWARDTDRAKAVAVAAAAEAALAAAREEAQRERKAWESLQATLEGSAAAREREAKEAAEEEGRKELRSVAAACRSAEETASALKLQLARAEADTAASVLRQQQAQAEAIRTKAQAEASVAASEGRAAAGAERLEEQLRAKARAESEAEEECRRVRAVLREAESRCRGLQDQVEEARARERRALADAEDARRRAATEADKKLAAAVDSERDRIVALKHKLEVAEDAARKAGKAARASAEGEAKGRRAASELAELARQQKAALQMARGEIGAACAERIRTHEAMETVKAEAARKSAEIKELRHVLEAREAELAAERQARRQHQKEVKVAEARAQALEQERKDADAKVEASAIQHGDLRAALMVKDKVLEDREKLVKELQLREGDALAEAQGWRDRLEEQQAEADQRLDAAREEMSELQEQVVALSGVEDQLREMSKELRRYRKRHEVGDDGDGDGEDGHEGGPSRETKGRREKVCSTELTAVAAVTAAAKAVEDELRAQLEAKDQALRYVESELLGMKSLFESKEACLRQELGEERHRLAREADVLRQRLAQAEAGRAAAEESARQQALTSDTLRLSVRNGDRRSKEVQ